MSEIQDSVKKGEIGYLPFEKFNTYGQPIIHFCYDVSPFIIRYWWDKDRQNWTVSLWVSDDESLDVNGAEIILMLTYIKLKEKIWWDKYGFLRKNEQESQERTE